MNLRDINDCIEAAGPNASIRVSMNSGAFAQGKVIKCSPSVLLVEDEGQIRASRTAIAVSQIASISWYI